MKKLIFILILMLAYKASSQSINLFDIDASEFPKMKAKVFALDENGNQLRPNIGDLKLSEDGIEREITGVSCSISKQEILSVSIIIDTYKNLDIAKEISRLIISNLRYPESEVSISVASVPLQIHQDFTRDRTVLLEKCNSIPKRLFASLNSMFYATDAGAIPMLLPRKSEKKLIILLTDLRSHNIQIDENQLYKDCQENNISIYSFLFGEQVNNLFSSMAINTNGLHFVNINNNNLLVNFAKFYAHQTNSICEIQWESQYQCGKNFINFELKFNSNNSTSNESYSIPFNKIPRLEISPTFLRFQNPIIGEEVSQEISVKAMNEGFDVNNIASTNPNFSISPNSFSLQPNESQTLTISYKAIDSGYTFASFIFENNVCERTLFVNGGYRGIRPKTSTLKVTHPNGGELFVIGSDTLITWEGIPAEEDVELEYSIDEGNHWQFITRTNGLSYRWKNIPPTPTEKCLIRVKQTESSDLDSNLNLYVITKFNRQPDSLKAPLFIRSFDYTPNGKYVICSFDESFLGLYGFNVGIIDLNTGELIKTFQCGGEATETQLSNISMGYDGSYFATFVKNRFTKDQEGVGIWDFNTGELIRFFKTNNFQYSLSKKSDLVLVNNAAWNPISGELVFKYPDYLSNTPKTISPDGKLVCYYDKSKLVITDLNHNLVIEREGSFGYPSFSPDNRYLALNNMSIAVLIEVVSGEVVWSIPVKNSDYYFSGTFSPDGKLFNSGSLTIEVETGRIVSHVTGFKFTSDGKYLSASRLEFNKLIDIHSDLNANGFITNIASYTNVYYLQDDKIVVFGRTNSSDSSETKAAYLEIIDMTTREVLKRHQIKLEIRRGLGLLNNNIVSENSKLLYLSFDGKSVSSININSGEVKQIYKRQDSLIINFATCNDNGDILVVALRDSMIIWDVKNEQFIQGLPKNIFSSIAVSPNLEHLLEVEMVSELDSFNLTKNYTNFTIWNINNGEIIRKWTDENKETRFERYIFNSSGTHFAAYSARIIKVYDMNTGQKIRTFHTSDRIGSSSHFFDSDICFIPNSTIIAFPSKFQSITLWDYNLDKIVMTRRISNAVQILSSSQDGKNIITANYEDAYMFHINIENVSLQEDQSDSLFAIVEPEVSINYSTIDMGEVLVNSSKDSLVVDVVCNIGDYPFQATGTEVTSGDANNFIISTGGGDFRIESGECQDLTFSFTPTIEGLFEGKVSIFAPSGDLMEVIEITGVGVESGMADLSDFINFERVRIGEYKELESVIIKNNNNSTVHFSGTTISGSNPDVFEIMGGSKEISLAPGEEYEVKVKFSPTERRRTSAILELHYDGVGSPAEVNLVGEGINDEAEILLSALSEFSSFCLNEDTQKLYIFNSGDLDLAIKELKIIGIDANEFEINRTSTLSIPQDDYEEIEINLKGKKEGYSTAQLKIESNAANNGTMLLDLNGVATRFEILFDVNTLLFDGRIGEEETQYITITNNSRKEVEITEIKGLQPPFSADYILPIVIPSFGNYDIEIKYIPSTYGQYQANLEFVFSPCNISNVVAVNGISKQNPSFVSKVSDYSGYTGDEIRISPKISGMTNIDVNTKSSFSADFYFNPTLLFPLDYQINKVDEKTAFIRLENINLDKAAVGESLFDIDFKVGLGNAEKCDLRLVNFAFTNELIEANVQNGIFTLLGINTEGGKRLLNPDAFAGIISVAPNPTSNSVNVTLSLSEVGETELCVYNILGEKVKSLMLEDIRTTGEREIIGNLSDLGNGSYYIVLITPSYITKENLMIIR